ncbi:pyridoxamine 5'-phosphate oxidase family protein [Alteribacillus sp. YIM 98480]|uniref:pyridoxamine 5'-phosphate oxidase family protein n=1 Tax=Alteribacillus sp. YIM 98480 TaxID=2606599 RepID=UPI001E5035C1|nr:pyridoxamine 5'-phosphate oxidase family protein [Alteribacillus sp. YIM 98480]
MMSDMITSKFSNIVSTEKDIESIIGTPGRLVDNKVVNYLDEHCQRFLSLSPFCVVATADKNGKCDASPRGDKQGFPFILDKKYLVLPERPGNRRTDSMRNIIENPHIGLLFFIPGMGETLRINGKATLINDAHVLEKMMEKNKAPLLGIAIEVEECFIHCAKAFKRSGLWDPSSWNEKESLPSAAQMLTDHSKLTDMTKDDIQAILDKDYKNRLY